MLEIIYISGDGDEETFDSHYATMPWLAIPFFSLKIKELENKCKPNGTPTLAVIGKDGSVLSLEGRDCFLFDDGKEFDPLADLKALYK